jgi:hypothetical protein
MAAVFTMSTATITLRTKVVPRWIGMLGIAVAVVLLVSVGLTVWVELLFPAWILLLSIDILRTGLRRSRAAAGTAMGPQALSMLATGCHRDSLANTARLLSHSRPLSDSPGRSGGVARTCTTAQSSRRHRHPNSHRQLRGDDTPGPVMAGGRYGRPGSDPAGNPPLSRCIRSPIRCSVWMRRKQAASSGEHPERRERLRNTKSLATRPGQQAGARAV